MQSSSGAPSDHHASHAANSGGGVAIAPDPAATSPTPPQIPPHLFGLLTSPAFVAAAAANPLFPPAALINPFLSMPEAFLAPQALNSAATQQVNQAPQQQQQQQPFLSFNPGAVMAWTNSFNANQQSAAPAATPPQFKSAGTAAAVASSNNSSSTSMIQSQLQSLAAHVEVASADNSNSNDAHLSPQERAKQNRDRNREHARSTRLRKKAYVQKLKELVDGLHAERAEEARQRRVAISHLAEVQNVRRNVIRTFLRQHAAYETQESAWKTILEEDFWFKQPVTPYRSFRRAEIENESRISRGLEAVIGDAASLAVMIESIGWRSSRWQHIKRKEFLQLEESHRSTATVPRCILQQDSRLAFSSLSSTSISSARGGGSSEEDSNGQRQQQERLAARNPESFSESDHAEQPASRDFHDYNAKPLPDPQLGDFFEERDSQQRVVPTDSDDSAAAIAAPRSAKRRKPDHDAPSSSSLPPNIAKKGGISHSIRPVVTANGSARLSAAPAVPLPPFSGIGKGTSSRGTSVAAFQGPALISNFEVETASSSASSGGQGPPQLRGHYHINEDDMILMEDVIMCPFIFRTHEAVVCGAFSECVMPGMIRATYSSRNKLKSMEMVYDSMGFMQQLERASGNEGSAHIIPGSLEMALSPTSSEAQVITLATPPFLIVNVNEIWTRTTGYTQMEVEGREYSSLLEGDATVAAARVRTGVPPHVLEEVAQGRCACSTNIHYDKEKRDFIEFVCSYPLTK
jgi:hypothetical protein